MLIGFCSELCEVCLVILCVVDEFVDVFFLFDVCDFEGFFVLEVVKVLLCLFGFGCWEEVVFWEDLM